MDEKYLSIITNFGCHFTCPYCISKTNGINVPKTTIEGLDGLTEAVIQTRATIVSISGGGDPIYNYPKNSEYYDKLFKWSWNTKIPLELHTSYIRCRGFHYGHFKRVVYHCHKLETMFNIRKEWNEKTRVVFVVTPDFTPEKIDAIATIAEHHPNIDELSFRQMIDKNYKVTNYCQDYLMAGHKKRWYYIEQNDYNIYYVNGKLFYRFADIGKEI